MGFEREYDSSVVGGGAPGAAAVPRARVGLRATLVEKAILFEGLAAAMDHILPISPKLADLLQDTRDRPITDSRKVARIG